MTLDMLAILVNAIVKATETANEIQHVLAIILIGMALGVGTWWAISILTASITKNFFRNLI